MARSITFGGITQKRPGAVSKISIGSVVPLTPAVGIVGMPGEADEGAPGELIVIDDPSIAKEVFGSGPLADALNPLFNPSGDALIPGGPGRCYAIKVNQSTAAKLQLNAASDVLTNGVITRDSNIFVGTFVATDVGSVVEILQNIDAGGAATVGRFQIAAIKSVTEAILVGMDTKSTSMVAASQAGVIYRKFRPQLNYTAIKHGLGGNDVYLGHGSGSAAGSYAQTIGKDETSETSPDLGGSVVLECQYTATPAAAEYSTTAAGDMSAGSTITVPSSDTNSFVGKYVEAAPTGPSGPKELRKIRLDTVGVSTHALTLFAAFTGTDATADVRVIDGVLFTGALAASSTDTSLKVSNLDLGSNELVGMMVEMTSGLANGLRRKITAHSTLTGNSTLTVASFPTGTIAVADTFKILYITDARLSVYGQGGKATKVLAYASVNGRAEGDVVSSVITSDKKLIQVMSELSASGKYSLTMLAGTPTNILASELDYGPASDNFGLDVRSEDVGLKLDMRAITSWVNDSSAFAQVSRAAEMAGSAYVYSGITLASVIANTITHTAGWVQIGSSIVYVPASPAIPALVSGDRELFVKADGTFATNQNVGSADAIKLADVTFNSTDFVVNPFLTVLDGLKAPVNAVGGGVPDTLAADMNFGTQVLHGSTGVTPAYLLIDSSTTTSLTDSSANFTDGLLGCVVETSLGQRRITGVLATKLTFKPALALAPTGSYRIIGKAIRGVSSNADWQDAADKMLKVRINHVIPLISEDLDNDGNGSTATLDSVHAIFKDHVITAAGAGKSERDCYLTMKGDKDALQTKSANLNDRNITFVGGQKHLLLDVDGSLKEFPEWSGALLACGMRAAAELALPLTFKFLNSQGMTNDSSWDPTDRTDANLMIDKGILFAETLPGRGIRWVRDLTTHLKDDNVAFFQNSSNSALNFAVYDLRTRLEEAFIGRKAIPTGPGTALPTAVSVAGVKAYIDTIMQGYIADGVVLEYNPLSTKVTINGNVCKVVYQIRIVNGLDFLTEEIVLLLPSE